MPAYKDKCPKCDSVKDARARMCLHCRLIHDHPRKGTGAERRLSAAGYVYINRDNKTVYEHRHVMEKMLGRKLRSDEHVHHIDGDKSNNSIKNLELLSSSEHRRHHFTPDRAKRLSRLAHLVRWGG